MLSILVQGADEDTPVSSSSSDMDLVMAVEASNAGNAAGPTTVTNKPLCKSDFKARDSQESVSDLSPAVRAQTITAIKERQEVAAALSQAIEVLRLAKVARDNAQKELAEAERKRQEAEATKRQALEILRMAREAIKHLK